MKTSNQERPPTDRPAEAKGRTPSRLTIESNRDDYRNLPNKVGLDHDVSVQGLRPAAAHSSALLQLAIGLISTTITHIEQDET